VELSVFVADFASALKTADSKRPQAANLRSGKTFRPGIGPHSEDAAIRLIVDELKQIKPTLYQGLHTGAAYPHSKQKCDLALGDPPLWAIEVKMARFSGDNGKPDDTSVKDIVSPYENDRSAVTDCKKLCVAGFPGRTAVLIYGFDDERRPLPPIIDAFEALARTQVQLGSKHAARFEGLVHPVHASGTVFAWEVSAK